MKTQLPVEINTVEEARKFLTELHNNNEAFHPDDDPMDIEYPDLPHDQVPTQSERKLLCRIMNDIHQLPDFDPSEVLVDLGKKGQEVYFSGDDGTKVQQIVKLLEVANDIYSSLSKDAMKDMHAYFGDLRVANNLYSALKNFQEIVAIDK
jgi:hypothetical protein